MEHGLQPAVGEAMAMIRALNKMTLAGMPKVCALPEVYAQSRNSFVQI